MRYLKFLRTRNSSSPKCSCFFFVLLRRRLEFEYNAGCSVMSVQLFAAFQSEPLSPVIHTALSRKKVCENIWKCWDEPNLKVLSAPVDAEGVSSLSSETALSSIFWKVWVLQLQSAVLKAVVSVAWLTLYYTFFIITNPFCLFLRIKAGFTCPKHVLLF